MYGTDGPAGAIRMIIHGEEKKAWDVPVSNPEPVAEQGVTAQGWR